MSYTRSLRSRLLLLLAFAFVVLLSGAVYHLEGMRASSVRRAKQAVLTTAELIAAKEAVELERAHALLHTVLPLIRAPESTGTQGGCNEILSSAIAHAPDIEDLVVASTNGNVLCSAKPLGRAFGFSTKPYFRAALLAREYVLGVPEVGPIAGPLVVPIAEPILDEANHVRGVLTAFVSLSWLTKERSALALPEDSWLAVLSAGGRFVLSVPSHMSDTKRGSSSLAVAKLAMGQQQGRTNTAAHNGPKSIYGFVPFLHTGSGTLFLAVGVPQHGIEAAANNSFLWGTAVALAVLALTFGIVWVGSERLVLRRVAALSGAARKLAEGTFTARSGLPPSEDELGSLARSFDEMAEGIQARQEQVERAKRALKVLSSGNRALVRVADEKSLFDEICRVVVEEGAYAIAWVGLAEHDEQNSIRPVAYRGLVRRQLNVRKLTWADGEGEPHPSSTAIRTAVPVIVRNVANDPKYEAWRTEGQEFGYGSIAALPLLVEGEVQGVLTVYAKEPDAFDAKEVEVLEETAEDLAFGVAHVRAQADRDRAEAALRRSEAWLRAATQGSLDAFCVLHPVRDEAGIVADLEFMEMNAKAEGLLRRSRKECIGRSLRELFPDYEDLVQRYLRAFELARAHEEQFSVRTPKGRLFWIRHQLIPFASGLAVFWRDVTEGMQASQALKASERKYRELMETLQEGVWAVDAEGRTTFVNDRMAKMVGYKVEDLLRKSAFALFGAPELSVLREQFQLRREAVVEPYELLVHRADSTSFYAHVAATPLYDEQGKFRGSLASVIDITKRKISELEVARANQALKTIGAANEALVRATEEEELLQAVCKVLVERGGYAKAWVGYAEDDLAKSIVPKAWAGVESDEPLRGLGLTWNPDTPSGQGPAGQAIRTAQMQLSQDLAQDPHMAYRRELVLAQGSKSLLTLPLLIREGRPHAVLCIHGSETNMFDEGHTALLQQLADDLSYGIEALRAKAERDRVTHEHLHHAEILRERLLDSIAAIAATVEMRDPYTAGHQKRVAQLAVAIAKELGMSDEKVQGLYLAGIVHDLGKLAVPAEILSKPGKLSDLEFSLVKQHADAGYSILKNIDFPWPMADIVHQHHERADGTGYPLGLKGDAILPEARVLAVADVVEAMASHRPYRASLGMQHALQVIEHGRGTAFDPAVVDACVKLFREDRFSFNSRA